jgi:hypothetical protein
MSDKPKVEIIQNTKSLAGKVRAIPGRSADDLLKGAGLRIESLTADFTKYLREEIDRLAKAAIEADSDATKRADVVRTMNTIFNDLRGNGGTYGYPLVTEVGDSACKFIADIGQWGAPQLAILRAHTDAMRAIMAANITGDGGPIGRQLLAGLKAAVDKVKPSAP